MKMPTPRGALLMALAGLVVAFFGAIAAGPRTPVVWLGVAIAAAGFIAWQVAARREMRRR